jgi:hypothetical protein
MTVKLFPEAILFLVNEAKKGTLTLFKDTRFSMRDINFKDF